MSSEQKKPGAGKYLIVAKPYYWDAANGGKQFPSDGPEVGDVIEPIHERPDEDGDVDFIWAGEHRHIARKALVSVERLLELADTAGFPAGL